jgi:hypothetical protein
LSPVLRAVLAGQHPSGKNQIQMSAPAAGVIRRFPKASFEAWRGTGYAQLDRQRGAWEKLKVPAVVTVRYTKGDLIRRDVPGMEDALCHLLEWCPIHGLRHKKGRDCPLPFVADDALLEDWHFVQLPLDREHPRLELVIEYKA